MRIQTVVKWFDESKGYGFLDNGSGPDIYVNWKSLTGEFTPQGGDRVELECRAFDGRLVGRNVRLLDRVADADDADAGYEDEPDDNFGNREQPPETFERPRFVMR